jgi:peptidoglycan/LPS O-acetylase OafA/YrhL
MATIGMPLSVSDHVPQATPSKQHRFLVLDAVRGVAAVLVALHHVPTSLRFLFPQSFLAVDLFFCLSGFVIAFSYENRLQTKMSIRAFTLARLIRLYPLYFLGTVIGFLDMLFHLIYFHEALIGAHLLLLAPALLFMPHFFSRRLGDGLFPLDGPAWSLFFEIGVNLIYALLIRIRAAVSGLLLTISVISVGFLIAMRMPIEGGDLFGTLPSGLTRVGYSFFVGVLLFRLYRKGFRMNFRGILAGMMPIFVILSVIFCLAFPTSPGYAHLWGCLVTCIAFPALIFLGSNCALTERWKSVCTFLGDFSYPLYVLHVPIFYILSVVEHFKLATLSAVLAPTTVILLIPLSWWIGKVYDAPIRKYLTSKT